MLQKIDGDPASEVSRIFKMAIDKNTHYLRHYRKLLDTFSDSNTCYLHYFDEFNGYLRNNVVKKADSHPTSTINDFAQINSNLSSPEFYRKYLLPEDDRQILTKYQNECSCEETYSSDD